MITGPQIAKDKGIGYIVILAAVYFNCYILTA